MRQFTKIKLFGLRSNAGTDTSSEIVDPSLSFLICHIGDKKGPNFMELW